MNPSSRPPYDIHDADYEQILDDLPAAPINRKSGLLSGLLLGGLGLFLLLSPIVAGVAIAYLITAGLLLYGISQTLAFFRVPKGERSGWSLLNGIPESASERGHSPQPDRELVFPNRTVGRLSVGLRHCTLG